MTGRLLTISRYPVKGLSAERLGEAAVKVGEALADDRRFALAHGTTSFDPAAPAWLPKTQFLCLMVNEKLATLETVYDPATTQLDVRRAGRTVTRGRLAEPTGRMVIEEFFAAYLGPECRGRPRIVEASGHVFGDYREKVISLISASAVRDLERVVGRPIDPARFRGNLLVEGLSPWAELGWVGRRLRIGDVPFRVVKRIQRCAATNVDPATGNRDLNLPLGLKRGFGHADLGVYLTPLTAGRIAPGDAVVLEDAD